MTICDNTRGVWITNTDSRVLSSQQNISEAMDFLAHLARHSCEEHIGAWLGNEGVHPSTHVLQALNEPGAACAS